MQGHAHPTVYSPPPTKTIGTTSQHCGSARGEKTKPLGYTPTTPVAKRSTFCRLVARWPALTIRDVARRRGLDGAVGLVFEDSFDAARRVPAGGLPAFRAAAEAAPERAADHLANRVDAFDAHHSVAARVYA